MMKCKSIKRICSILFAMIIAFSFHLFVYAESISNSVENKIITALQNTEYIKDKIGLENIDFCELDISNPISTYEFTNNGFVFLRNVYPLLNKGIVVALAFEVGNGAERTYQISTAFVEKINNMKNDTPLTLVYDKEGAYLYYENNFLLLGLHSEKIDNRLKFRDFDVTKINTEKLKLVEITNGKKLNYTNSLSSRAQIYYECDVDFVSQNPPSNICWAASCAMIINSVRGYHYTAEQIARAHFGNNFNYRIPIGDEVDVLSDFSVAYTYTGTIPSNGVMLHNIRYGWPVYANFFHQSGTHAVVIYGINASSGYIYIIDPEKNASDSSQHAYYSASYNYSNGYSYVSSYSGVVLTLNYGTCHYWTAG